MRLLDRLVIVIVVVACILGVYWGIQPASPMPVIEARSLHLIDPGLPDFTTFTELKDKKSAFFDFVLPLIEQENRRIAELRLQLQKLQQQESPLTATQQQWLNSLALRYQLDKDKLEAGKFSNNELYTQLLVRVDQIPPSLALAQSANESAWGTSRFAVEGNNLFGQWCFSKGCGLVPSDRQSGDAHEVASFASPRQSVESYIHNLNTNVAYQGLRNLRASLRQQTETISGFKVAQGLSNYSSRGDDYVKELQSMIRINKLDRLDTI